MAEIFQSLTILTSTIVISILVLAALITERSRVSLRVAKCPNIITLDGAS